MDNKGPQFIGGTSLLLWGFSSDFIWLSIPMAIVLEGRYYFPRRWALEQQDFYRVADLTSLALVGLVIYLSLNARATHFLITLVQWLPLLFFPLVAVIAYSTRERMSLDVLFYSLRRQSEPVEQSWDMDYLLIGLCLVALGTNYRLEIYFLPLAALLFGLSFFRIRSRRYRLNVWLLCGLLTVSAAFLAATLLRESHLALKEQTGRWLAGWIKSRTDPLRTRTAIGAVGQMKLSDSVIFRVAPEGIVKIPTLLFEASYDLPSKNDWMALNADFQLITHSDDFKWDLNAPSSTDHFMKIYLEFDESDALIPVPSSVTQIADLPAVDIKQSRYGAIQGTGLVPSPFYRVGYNHLDSVHPPPNTSDTYLPKEFDTLMSRIDTPTQFTTDQDRVNYARTFFRSFRYSLYQRNQGHSEPLEHFFLTSKAGHCEYFASATTLLLRKLGIPARYVVGYALQEYDPGMDMYLVRQRHAHAWAIAFVGGAWQIVDTTPSIWLEQESAQASFTQPLADFLSNNLFLFKIWWNQQKLEDYEWHLYILGAMLTLVLGWRIATSDQVILEEEAPMAEEVWDPTASSPFTAIQNHLNQAGYHRARGESLRQWLTRIQHDRLITLLIDHYRWRFDQDAMTPQQRSRLQAGVDEWLSNDSQNSTNSHPSDNQSGRLRGL